VEGYYFRSGPSTYAILWFGNREQENEEKLTQNEKMIENYNKEYGNMFYIPKGVKEYLQENGAGKEWKKILDEINRKHIYMRMEIYHERCKEHSKVMNTKKLKKEWVEGKRIKIIEDPLDHIPKKLNTMRK
jgi:hypothetical protein